MNKNVLLLAASLFFSTLFAGGDIMHPQTAVSKTSKKFYIGIGVSDMRLCNEGSDEAFSVTGALFQLGYQINPYLAVEARYVTRVSDVRYDPGHTAFPADDHYPADFSNIGLYLKPQYPIGGVTLYGLLGYGEVRITNVPIGDVARAEAGLQWGVGISYAIKEDLRVFVDYMSLYDGRGFDDLATLYDHKAALITIGLSYRF